MEKKNLNKLCGSCEKPCERSWCVTLDSPEDFQDYLDDDHEKKS